MRTTGLLILAFVCISCSTLSEEVTKKDNDGSIKISFYTDIAEKKLSTYMTGFNLSYYHDKDAIWADGHLANGLKDVRAKLLRYPGGAETAYFHWRYPGCPGYTDLWNPEHGVNIDEISQITENMDTDEFMSLCNEIGAEPLLGINIQSGVVNNRLDDSLQEAVDWMNYCKSKGYKVKYWYLDGEVDHWGSYTQITVEEYADIINKFSKKLKAVDPDIKLIVNLIGGATAEKNKTLIKLAGESFDIIDFHYYYAWDIAEWSKWTSQCPMINTDTNLTYVEDINSLSSYIKSSINPNIEIVCLEWNIAPTKVEVISDYKQALMQTEMFQQLLRSDLQMACIWPLIWKVEEGTFPTIFNQKDYSHTPLYEILKLYSEVLGNTQTFSISSDLRIVAHSVVGEQAAWVCAINKYKQELPVKIELNGNKNYSKARIHIVSSDDIDSNSCKVTTQEIRFDDNIATFTAPAFSFIRVDFN